MPRRSSSVRVIRSPASVRFWRFREFAALLEQTHAPVVGVSPIIGSAAISGPAHKLMIASGFEASAIGVARCYTAFLDTLLIANEDRAFGPAVAALEVAPVYADIRMGIVADKRRLAREVLALVKK